MTYTAWWFRFPNGNENESMVSYSKDFTDLDEAKAFLDKKWLRIKGNYWAGGYVDDEKGNILYDRE